MLVRARMPAGSMRAIRKKDAFACYPFVCVFLMCRVLWDYPGIPLGTAQFIYIPGSANTRARVRVL
jgi:hypothetical protein